MLSNFNFAAGSIAGTEHVRPDQPGFKNNQDAYSLRTDDNLIVGVVCDGCGSGGHSEFGARFASRFIANKLHRWISDNLTHEEERDFPTPHIDLIEQKIATVKETLLGQIGNLAIEMSTGGPSNHPAIIAQIVDSLLFTVVGFVMTKEHTVIFGMGDGVYAVNDEITILEPEQGNAPVYLAYALTGSPITDEKPHLLNFQIHKSFPTSDVKSLLIGTDGCADLIKRADDLTPQGDPVGGLNQFWSENMMLCGAGERHSPKAQRRLNLLNQSKYRINRDTGTMDKRHGVLHDDTTLISVRRM